jgi:hydrogenase maturation protease
VRRLVVGVGNAYRCDDAAALAVVGHLRRRVPAGVEVRTCEDEPARLVDELQGADVAVVVDAVAGGAEPGTVHRFDASVAPLPVQFFRSSTHAFSLGEAIEVARALGRLPRRLVVFGIEGESFTAGTDLSPPVEAAVLPVADAVLEELAGLPGERR